MISDVDNFREKNYIDNEFYPNISYKLNILGNL